MRISSARSPDPARARVWDPLVRVLHWSLVAAFAASWLTRHSPGRPHEWLGYAVLAILALRVAWGFCGSRYARFSQFLRSPARTLAYARSVVDGRTARYVGHNPLGAWMIVLMIATVLGICASGWLYTTDRFWGIEWVETVHRRLTNLGLALVGLHLCGVAFTSIQEGENLVASMLHGRKREARPGDVD